MCTAHTINKLRLIKLVRERPVLWDVTSSRYQNKWAKTGVWREICNELKCNYKYMSNDEQQDFCRNIKKIWTHTRDTWLRTLTSSKNTKNAGTVKKLYKYHREMLFLMKIQKYRQYLTKTDESLIADDEEHHRHSSEQSETSSITVCENEENIDIIKEEFDDTAVMEQEIEEGEETDSIAKDVTVPLAETLDGEIITYINTQVDEYIRSLNITQEQQTSRHASFFQSLLPTLAFFDDDQILEFQSGVINLIRSIKDRGKCNDWSNNQPSSITQGQGLFQRNAEGRRQHTQEYRGQPAKDTPSTSKQPLVMKLVYDNDVYEESPSISSRMRSRNLDPLQE